MLLYHVFPDPDDLQAFFDRILEVCKDKKVDPVEKACRVWFDCVKNHYCFGANKRTGRALAIGILLSHGYFPPKVNEGDNGYSFSDLRVFEEENGFENFINYINNGTNLSLVFYNPDFDIKDLD